jgi:hypothetical protein
MNLTVDQWLEILTVRYGQPRPTLRMVRLSRKKVKQISTPT